jgi:hypothetical protein
MPRVGQLQPYYEGEGKEWEWPELPSRLDVRFRKRVRVKVSAGLLI